MLSDFIAARELLASVLIPTVADGFAARYHHDHDEELGKYWYKEPVAQTPRQSFGQASNSVGERRRDETYWAATIGLLLEYFELQSGGDERLLDGFAAWIDRCPTERRLFEDGDDMTRAALVDWYLRLVR
jgi:hypothetical protein